MSLDKNSLDKASQEMLATILGKDKRSLGADEVAFLIGRRVYLNEEEYERYEDLFAVADGKGEASESADEGSDAPVEPKPKKGKK